MPLEYKPPVFWRLYRSSCPFPFRFQPSCYSPRLNSASVLSSLNKLSLILELSVSFFGLGPVLHWKSMRIHPGKFSQRCPIQVLSSTVRRAQITYVKNCSINKFIFKKLTLDSDIFLNLFAANKLVILAISLFNKLFSNK